MAVALAFCAWTLSSPLDNRRTQFAVANVGPEGRWHGMHRGKNSSGVLANLVIAPSSEGRGIRHSRARARGSQKQTSANFLRAVERNQSEFSFVPSEHNLQRVRAAPAPADDVQMKTGLAQSEPRSEPVLAVVGNSRVKINEASGIATVSGNFKHPKERGVVASTFEGER